MRTWDELGRSLHRCIGKPRIPEDGVGSLGSVPAPVTTRLLQAGRESKPPHLPCLPNAQISRQRLRSVGHDLISVSLPRGRLRGAAFVCGARRQTDSSREAPVNHGSFQPVTSKERRQEALVAPPGSRGCTPAIGKGHGMRHSRGWLWPCVGIFRFW